MYNVHRYTKSVHVICAAASYMAILITKQRTFGRIWGIFFFFWSIDIYNNKVPLGRYTYTTRLPLTVTTKNNGCEIFFPCKKCSTQFCLNFHGFTKLTTQTTHVLALFRIRRFMFDEIIQQKNWKFVIIHVLLQYLHFIIRMPFFSTKW